MSNEEIEAEAKKIVDYSLWLLLEAMDMKVDPKIHNHSNILKGLGIDNDLLC